ncbi:MAG TPA: sigma-70 family RNA polymerase sigma factor [Verrucomicrobiae bacterium]|nr:sigma-70 family RNA polymerase sigma factor [Verrucomicrobiae bacterium]
MSYYSTQDDLSFIPLTLAEEHALIARYHGNNDLAARDELVRVHLKLVAKLSLRFARGAILDEDAISAGNFALMQALECKKFDPARGSRFGTYIRSYVKGEVLKQIRQRTVVRPEFHQPSLPPDAVVTGTAAGNEDADKNRPEFSNLVDQSSDEQQIITVRETSLEDAIDQLPALEGYAVRRVDLQGGNYADVGRERNVSREAARKAHARGLQKLRFRLNPVQSQLN